MASINGDPIKTQDFNLTATSNRLPDQLEGSVIKNNGMPSISERSETGASSN